MNIRLWLGTGAMAGAFISCGVGAQTAPVEYEYGMNLDIAKVVALTEPDQQVCEVVMAQMTYIDSSGQQRELLYRKLADVCSYRD